MPVKINIGNGIQFDSYIDDEWCGNSFSTGTLDDPDSAPQG